MKIYFPHYWDCEACGYRYSKCHCLGWPMDRPE